MTQFPLTDNPSRMGRPPLAKNEETKTTAVRMPVSVFDRIVAVAGPHRMAAFIRDAIDNELKRREAEKSKESA